MSEQLRVWFVETFINIQGYEFGVHEVSSDLEKQVKMWECFGCNASATTSWPEWGEPDFKHEKGCKFLELMALLRLRPVSEPGPEERK